MNFHFHGMIVFNRIYRKDFTMSEGTIGGFLDKMVPPAQSNFPKLSPTALISQAFINNCPELSLLGWRLSLLKGGGHRFQGGGHCFYGDTPCATCVHSNKRQNNTVSS